MFADFKIKNRLQMKTTTKPAFDFSNVRRIKSLIACLLAGCFVAGATADDRKERKFKFTYSASIVGVPKGANVKVWIPIAQSTEYQKIKIIENHFPSEAKITTEKKYGNKMLFFEKKFDGKEKLEFGVQYDVVRYEALSSGDKPSGTEMSKFLTPNRLVPVDGKPVEIFNKFLESNGKNLPKDPLATGRLLYDFVEDHMTYDKSKPGYGTGDSNWACDSRTGNCTDFHSLFISVARANKVPAQFRIGFPLPEKRGVGNVGGYHCWAFFHAANKGWVPVDISEADKAPEKKEYFFGRLNENRIQFTIGRDIDLVPKQESDSLNYFVYPHVEVDGKELDKKQIQTVFRYADHK